MSDLRSSLIKLAHEVPELRKHLVPILQRNAMEFDSKKQLEEYLKDHPNADKSKHKVRQEGTSPNRYKELNGPQWFKDNFGEHGDDLRELAGYNGRGTAEDLDDVQALLKKVEPLLEKQKKEFPDGPKSHEQFVLRTIVESAKAKVRKWGPDSKKPEPKKPDPKPPSDKDKKREEEKNSLIRGINRALSDSGKAKKDDAFSEKEKKSLGEALGKHLKTLKKGDDSA